MQFQSIMAVKLHIQPPTASVPTLLGPSDSKQQGLGQPPSWVKLPPELLVHIFSHLDSNDKENAEATCRVWEQACDVPSLWRSREFYFDGTDSIGLVTRGCSTIKRRGKYLRHLTIGIDHPRLPQAWIVSQCVQQLLEFISQRSHAQHIQSFKVKKLDFFSQWRFYTFSRKNIITAVNAFLTSQNHLLRVDFTSCRFSADEGMSILRALHVSLSRLSLQRLELHEFFQKNYSATCGKRFTYWVTSSFPVLEQLGVDAKHISDEFLHKLTDKSPYCRRLRKVKIYFEMFRSPRMFISEQCWCEVRKACPDLQVAFVFDGWLPYLISRRVLVPSVPLMECVIAWPRVGHRYRQDRRGDLSETIERISALYFKILTRFTLHAEITPYPQLESSLIKLAATCQRLEEFNVSMRLNQEVIDQILSDVGKSSSPGRSSTKVVLHQIKSRSNLPRLRPRNRGNS